MILDLTLPISENMWIYPGDKKPSLALVSKFKDDGWNMRRIKMNSHDGTHINVPIHGTKNGKNLDDYEILDFMGLSVLFENEQDIQKDIGLIFNKKNINWDIAKKIVEIRPKFIGLPAKFEFDIEIEKYLLEEDIISFERLTNTEKLPKKFIFHGVPLKILKGDGSPIRAYATFE